MLLHVKAMLDLSSSMSGGSINGLSGHKFNMRKSDNINTRNNDEWTDFRSKWKIFVSELESEILADRR